MSSSAPNPVTSTRGHAHDHVLEFLSAEVDVAKAQFNFKIVCAEYKDWMDDAEEWKRLRAKLENQLKDARIAQEQIAENQRILEESKRSASEAAEVFSDAEQILKTRVREIDAKRIREIAAINAARDEEVEAVRTELGILPKATARDAAGVALDRARRNDFKSQNASAEIVRIGERIAKTDDRIDRCSKERADLEADLAAKAEKLGSLRQFWEDREPVGVRFRNLAGAVLWSTDDFKDWKSLTIQLSDIHDFPPGEIPDIA